MSDLDGDGHAIFPIKSSKRCFISYIKSPDRRGAAVLFPTSNRRIGEGPQFAGAVNSTGIDLLVFISSSVILSNWTL